MKKRALPKRRLQKTVSQIIARAKTRGLSFSKPQMLTPQCPRKH